MKNLIPFGIFILGFVAGAVSEQMQFAPTPMNVDRRENVLLINYTPNTIASNLLSDRHLQMPLDESTWEYLCTPPEVTTITYSVCSTAFDGIDSTASPVR